MAERLADWLGWTDAIALADALQARPAATRSRAPGTAALAAELERLRTALAAEVQADALLADPAAEAAERRRQYQAYQRTMDQRIAPLRAALRQALAATPTGARLAALDAVLDRALAARERHLLAGVPTLLAARETTPWPEALIAELDLRLQPLHGLLEALQAAAGGRGA